MENRNSELTEKILSLKKTRGAVILASNCQPEHQYSGASLQGGEETGRIQQENFHHDWDTTHIIKQGGENGC